VTRRKKMKLSEVPSRASGVIFTEVEWGDAWLGTKNRCKPKVMRALMKMVGDFSSAGASVVARDIEVSNASAIKRQPKSIFVYSVAREGEPVSLFDVIEKHKREAHGPERPFWTHVQSML